MARFRQRHDEQHGLRAPRTPVCLQRRGLPGWGGDPLAGGHHVQDEALRTDGKILLLLIPPFCLLLHLLNIKASDLKELPPSPFLPGGLGLVRPDGFPAFQVKTQLTLAVQLVKSTFISTTDIELINLEKMNHDSQFLIFHFQSIGPLGRCFL